MTFIDVAHLVLCAFALCCTVMHMNAMCFEKTPKLEMGAWWLLSVGLFGEIFWQLFWWFKGVSYFISEEHVLMTFGISMLVVIHSQPEWRPMLADRRKNPTGVLPPDCDRRCQTLMNTRRTNTTELGS